MVHRYFFPHNEVAVDTAMRRPMKQLPLCFDVVVAVWA
jgi:hypothetical protein